MRNRTRDEAETFDRATRFSRERDHERKIDNRGERSRQDRIWRYLHRFAPHHFTETRKLNAHQRTHCFRRDIALTDSGPARRQNECATLTGQGTNRLLDSRNVIRYDRFGLNLPAEFFRGFFQRRSAKIDIFAGRCSIGDCDDADHDRSVGVLECWSIGILSLHYSFTPLLQRSIRSLRASFS